MYFIYKYISNLGNIQESNENYYKQHTMNLGWVRREQTYLKINNCPITRMLTCKKM